MSALQPRPTKPEDTMQGVPRPPLVPARGSRLLQRLAWWYIRRQGWDIRGEVPNEPKFVLIGAPHSSNHDWIWAMWTMLALRVRFSYMVKATFFVWPLSPILRWLGAVEARRGKVKGMGMIESSIRAFQERDQMLLAIAAEGRVKPVRALKRGFYEIAKGADVPVLVISFRYDEKVIGIDGLLDMSGSLEDVQARLFEHYGEMKGRHRGYLDNLDNWAVSPLDKDVEIYD